MIRYLSLANDSFTNSLHQYDLSLQSDENGSHQNKKVFVRGCLFPDYAEIGKWPADSMDGTVGRLGIPAIRELTLEANMEKDMGNNINSNMDGGGSGSGSGSGDFIKHT